MAEVLTAREAEALFAAGEALQAKLDACEARAASEHERAERIAADMELLEKELRAKRRNQQDLVRERNERHKSDPMGDRVKAIADYYRERTGRTARWKLDPPRFDLIKAALTLYKDEADPDAILRHAIDGAAAFPFCTSSSVRSDKRAATGKRSERQDHIDLVLRNAKYIEKFCGLADEAGAPEEHAAAPVREVAAGDARTQVTRFDPTPLERAIKVLGREFGIDRVWPLMAEHGDLPAILEYWSPCPLHPSSEPTLRVRHKGWGRVAVGSRTAVEFACVNGCSHDRIEGAVRDLEAGQEARSEAVVIPIRPEERAA